MESLAVVLLAVFSAGYLVLAGADVGVGMLLPWLGRDERERRLVIASFAPFFLGNEVWLVAAAGLVAGAFPGLEHELLAELYPLVVVLLVGWVVRDMGLWLRGRVDAAAWRAVWDGAVVAGSWALALAWGSVLGSVLGGGGLNAGSVLGLPLALVFAWHGAGFARWRLPVGLAGRAVRVGGVPSRYGVSAVVLAVAPVVAGVRLPWSGSAADGAGLTMTAVVTVVVLPLLVGAQALVWWTFRGRVESPSYL
ncbi:cytochrome d ubiquinol oxidase subunit II [Actinomadura decatromicini]|uniref:Cytochrome d ubiquinol oxidase subunit II n=1 Tax=Actinomadura decatromicini TaxID=2604572 RepID=A0A5D3FAZ1_9ACTN|nr:cytochrome d ubiquinol oxidase subunit II [Actinomadura decatromicini]TYK45006.1 cytochrome d ubiquinol oxidase subunit II [Actinomadura decatromicini]